LAFSSTPAAAKSASVFSVIKWDDFEEALAAVRDVGPGRHYLGHPHTQTNFQRTFFVPKLFDNNSIEQWIADGGKDTTKRALAQARRLLSEYEEPKLSGCRIGPSRPCPSAAD
jgi:trimethylamine:corrinoid methyltransferase-like protein